MLLFQTIKAQINSRKFCQSQVSNKLLELILHQLIEQTQTKSPQKIKTNEKFMKE